VTSCASAPIPPLYILYCAPMADWWSQSSNLAIYYGCFATWGPVNTNYKQQGGFAMAGAWLDSVNVNNKRGTLISAKGEGAAHKASTIKVAQWKKLAAVERKYNKCTHTQAVVRVPYLCLCRLLCMYVSVWQIWFCPLLTVKLL